MMGIYKPTDTVFRKIIFLILFFTLLCGSGRIFAQSKADEYFSNNEFSKAIPLYKKSADKNEDAMRKLGDCYRMMKNYAEAEETYKKLVQKKTSNAMVYYYYGQALLSNNKYDEAKQQFLTFSVLSPDDNRGELYSRICDQVKNLLAKPALYKVYNLGSINTSVADFCPAFYEDGIVFSSEKVKDLINFTQSGSTGNSLLSLVYSKGEKILAKLPADSLKLRGKDSIAYGDAKLFSDKFTGDSHFGPACFNADFTEIIFMKVETKAPNKNGLAIMPKLYSSKYKNGWSTPEVLPFCSDEFATGHPSLSKDGQFLYFISNRSGGWGGTDIWVSKREANGWGIPQNLGKEINTPDDEAYPYINAENILYFSSKGHAGFGGLDIYASLQKVPPDARSGGKWAGVSNLMPPVNSTANDFGIILKDGNSGYFSSNRAGGTGNDDLYGFALSGLITSVAGKILLSPNTFDAAPNVKVFLLSNKGEVMRITSTDVTGLFKFDNLPTDQSYMVKVDENDPIFKSQKKIYLTDDKERVVRVVGRNKDGFFVFENLPADLNRLTRLEEEDVSIAGNLYAGDERAPLKNAVVKLLNDKGEMIQQTTTNSFGSMVFMHIPSEENVTIALESIDPAYATKKIYFTNKSGKEIVMGEGRSFRFKLLASDKNTMSLLKVFDTQLLVDLEGTLYSDKLKKTPLARAQICLVDEKGNVVGTYQTDEFGNFRFKDLPANRTFLVRLKEEDLAIYTKDVFMADSKGKIVATLRFGGKFFRYSLLPSEEKDLMKIYFNDPWLLTQASMKTDGQVTIIENIYYEYQKWNLGPQALITLNKVADIMQSNKSITVEIIAHTDSRGSEDFNLQLSGKRAQAAVDYIISKGISKARLTAKGVGETRLANNCADGVNCSEEEHAQNRRTEFTVRKGNN